MIPQDPQEALAQVKKFLKRIKHDQLDPEQIRPEARFVEDLGLDSLDLMEVRFDIESTWQVSIDDAQAAELKTIGDIISLVQSAQAGAAQGSQPQTELGTV